MFGETSAINWQVSRVVSTTSDLQMRVNSGQVQLLGVFGEARPPGLVLDSLGINGARLATLLSWDADDWSAHLRARQPDLVVLAYGTNEAGDGTNVKEYYAGYASIVDRIHSVRAACLLVGPTDRQDRAGRSLQRVEEL